MDSFHAVFSRSLKRASRATVRQASLARRALLPCSFVVALGVSACERPAESPTAPAAHRDSGSALHEPPTEATEADAGRKAETGGPSHAQRVLTRIERDIARWRQSGDERKGWYHFEQLASAHLARARVLANADDYVAAGAALEQAFALANAGTGPFFQRAQYNYALDRLDEVEGDLRAARKSLAERPEDVEAAESLRGDVALKRGDLDAARRHYQAAIAARRSFAAVARHANLDLQMGRYGEARTGFDEVLTLTEKNPMQHAWTLLQRGAVEEAAGDFDAALALYERADTRFSGWYVIEERIGDTKMVLGEVDAAIARYDAALGQAPRGGLMAKLGDAWARKGDAALAAEWRAKAREQIEAELAKAAPIFAEDAIRFYSGEQPRRGLELARAHARRQPGPAAQVLVAQAQLATGDRAGAQATLRAVQKREWGGQEFAATLALTFDAADGVSLPPVDVRFVEHLRGRLRMPAPK